MLVANETVASEKETFRLEWNPVNDDDEEQMTFSLFSPLKKSHVSSLRKGPMNYLGFADGLPKAKFIVNQLKNENGCAKAKLCLGERFLLIDDQNFLIAYCAEPKCVTLFFHHLDYANK